VAQKVLVIEDEPTLARLLSYNLLQEGYETTVVEHGGEGLQEALRNPYDLLILDVMLPGMNGFEVLSRFRQQGHATPVIILTARGAEEEIVQGLRLGACLTAVLLRRTAPGPERPGMSRSVGGFIAAVSP